MLSLRYARVIVTKRPHGWTAKRKMSSKPPSSSSSSPLEGESPLTRAQRAKARAKARAEQLEAEIENIVSRQDRRHAQDEKKAKSVRGFAEFLGSHKTNVSVIIVSFLTVVLSVKLVQGKQRYRELEEELKTSNATIDDQRTLLKTVTGDEFLSKIAQNCANRITSKDEKSGSWFGRSSLSLGPLKNDNLQLELSSVMANDLKALIGDAGLSEDERRAKELRVLAAEGEDERIEKLAALSSQSDASTTSRDDEPQEVVEKKDAEGNTVVKKSVFRI